MANRKIEITCERGHTDTIRALGETKGVIDVRVGLPEEDGRQTCSLIVGPANRQIILDKVQTILGGSENWSLTVLPVEAVLPVPAKSKAASKSAARSGVAKESREELMSDAERGAEVDLNFILLVVLSTIVAAIGLLENNVAVVIGAMVIAPLLGPNLALALAASLGARKLLVKSIVCNLTGVTISLTICFALGTVYPIDFTSTELMSRTDVSYSGIALALASGAAAALSLTNGLSSTLVGVMVAVALLPPAATVGLVAGAGRTDLALGALLLLVVNVVCVNLSTMLLFLFKGISPRTGPEKQVARHRVLIYAGALALMLAALAAVIWLRQSGTA